MAGDEDTALTIDLLLREIQTGVNQLGSSALPDVWCLYYRWEPVAGIRTFYYRLSQHTLKFGDTWSLDLNAYPPGGSTQLGGALDEQVTSFLEHVQREFHPWGPIRIIIGAHGIVGRGFYPTNASETAESIRLPLASGILERKKPEAVSGNKAPASKVPASKALDHKGPGNNAEAGSSELIRHSGRVTHGLKLDDAALALSQLPTDRIQTLILHACQMSGVETISALSMIPHHIACASVLSGYLSIGGWLATLADPAATDLDITCACSSVMHLPPKPTATGCFSSHHTHQIDLLLKNLNSLGVRLYELIVQADQSAAQKAIDSIKTARFTSSVSAYIVDVSRFCTSLGERRVVPDHLLVPIVEQIKSLQVQAAMRTDPFRDRFPYSLFKGINLFFPESGIEVHSTKVLPNSFQQAAPEWCVFVDEWIK